MDAQTVGEKPRCAVIGWTVILPECRRHGLGRMLLTLAAGEAVERQIWFLAARVPQDEAALRFADAIHMKQTEWFDDLRVLDLSDVEGLRYGTRART
jgi:GNAT superfamily N-acetyltransferase